MAWHSSRPLPALWLHNLEAIRREKEAADMEQPIGTSGIREIKQFLANGKGFFFVKIS